MTRRLIVEADGGSRGNPGVAGYGSLVRDADTGALLAERAAPLGKESNNVAEYTGLIEGLRAVVDHAPGAAVTVRMDSKLVVEQMSGRWKIKHEDMKRLAAEAQALAVPAALAASTPLTPAAAITTDTPTGMAPATADRLAGLIDPRRAMAAMPPLLRTYLMMGGWVSDHAVMDRQLGTMHVFTGVEIRAIPPARRRLLHALAQQPA